MRLLVGGGWGMRLWSEFDESREKMGGGRGGGEESRRSAEAARPSSRLEACASPARENWSQWRVAHGEMPGTGAAPLAHWAEQAMRTTLAPKRTMHSSPVVHGDWTACGAAGDWCGSSEWAAFRAPSFRARRVLCNNTTPPGGILTFALNAQLPIGRARGVPSCHWPLEPIQAALAHFFEGIELFAGGVSTGRIPRTKTGNGLLDHFSHAICFSPVIRPSHPPTYAGECMTSPIKTGPRGDMFYSAPIPPPAPIISTAPSHSLHRAHHLRRQDVSASQHA